MLDRAATVDIQREYGMDANPWAVTPRSITSMDFLRQPDVLAAFLAAAQRLERGHALAWDLLVVDEAHNLAPLGFSERSDRAEDARRGRPARRAPAVPLGDAAQRLHGELLRACSSCSTRCGSVRPSELTDAERDQVDLVMVRRLKSELNERAQRRGEVPPFTDRARRADPVHVDARGAAPRRGASRIPPRRQRGCSRRSVTGSAASGGFVFSLLTKRLLSCPYALARTWWRHIEGYADDRLARRG